jgi:hypothetical protein
VSAEKFVAQISVAMLSVDKIEPQFPSHSRRAVVVLDDAADLPVGEDGIVRRQSHPPVQNRMTIKDAGLRPVEHVGSAEAPGVCELHADEQAAVRACGRDMLLDENSAKTGQPSTVCSAAIT